MENLVTSGFKLGIISGGQLGKLLSLAASNWDVQTYILDSSADCPAAKICTHLTIGNAINYDDVVEFGKKVDMIALEIEHVNIDALKKLKSMGKKVYPDPEILEIIQDKGSQKLFYSTHNIPTSKFKLYESKEEIICAISKGDLSLPFVQKSRKDGYDGKGVKIVRVKEDLDALLNGASVVEELIKVKKEIAVIAAKNTNNEVACFPPVEMVFNSTVNLVEQLICPANIDASIQKEAIALGKLVIEKFGMEGILAVEMFLTEDNKLYVNEVAPRPHNSGHHTVESTITSQYEQYLRAIFGFSLGSTAIKLPSVMINLLGELDHFGKVKYVGLSDSMKIEGVKVHIYGKKETKPYRKMGHVTIMDHTINEAIKKSNLFKSQLKVKSW